MPYLFVDFWFSEESPHDDLSQSAFFLLAMPKRRLLQKEMPRLSWTPHKETTSQKE